ncbi:DUF2637 domain-containing protein [Streptomyces massasporeus]|uniref:DUF2637 domain-containing protein n=1 Tax=Streptomyces massasporeus TaxID=67324 RepID=UPI0036CA81C8
MIIAGIGFAGSYTAVQQLAHTKGFGTFSHLYPIGIDAGICVTLALDLLLTWNRTPYPLLRHTAWLLTSATITFNAAAAWPDPLAVAMHAVIPLLFIACVEAARHTIGRITDITANTHIEPVRLTRWLLAPLPTFLLWRRMKIWELRSYDHVIKLEQERLTYQAHLRIRYGRAWRRTAPIEALLPLRLARHGIPLTHPTPAGNESAQSLQPPESAPIPHHSTTPQSRTDNDGVAQPNRTPSRPESTIRRRGRITNKPPEKDHRWPARARQASSASSPVQTDRNRTGAGWRNGNGFGSGTDAPTPRAGLTPAASSLNARHTPGAEGTSPPPPATPRRSHDSRPSQARSHHTGAERPPQQDDVSPTHHTATTPAAAAAAAQPSDRTAHAPTHNPPAQPEAAAQQQAGISTVDRYYLAWTEYKNQHGTEPTDKQLSAHLANQGIYSRNHQPVSPATLRRYLLSYRLYDIWAQHRTHNPNPTPQAIAHHCNTHGITAQYNKPITPHHITQHTHHFQRRWHTLNHHQNTHT